MLADRNVYVDRRGQRWAKVKAAEYARLVQLPQHDDPVLVYSERLEDDLLVVEPHIQMEEDTEYLREVQDAMQKGKAESPVRQETAGPSVVAFCIFLVVMFAIWLAVVTLM